VKLQDVRKLDRYRTRSSVGKPFPLTARLLFVFDDSINRRSKTRSVSMFLITNCHIRVLGCVMLKPNVDSCVLDVRCACVCVMPQHAAW
jgi:hypothetical protein